MSNLPLRFLTAIKTMKSGNKILKTAFIMYKGQPDQEPIMIFHLHIPIIGYKRNWASVIMEEVFFLSVVMEGIWLLLVHALEHRPTWKHKFNSLRKKRSYQSCGDGEGQGVVASKAAARAPSFRRSKAMVMAKARVLSKKVSRETVRVPFVRRSRKVL